MRQKVVSSSVGPDQGGKQDLGIAVSLRHCEGTRRVEALKKPKEMSSCDRISRSTIKMHIQQPLILLRY